jgi:SAM-dependent methyltransferase
VGELNHFMELKEQLLPVDIEGFPCYAPELAISNEDFPAEGFEDLFRHEETNFWFVTRNQVIINLMRKYTRSQDFHFLEIGCGTGYVLNAVQKITAQQAVGAEIHIEGLKFARLRVPKAKFIQLDATRIPFSDSYDAAGAFDVLEHISADEIVMQQIYKALKPGGFFYISVPQYPWMWSYLDDIAYHKRRYTRKELTSKLHTAGFQIPYCGSFVFTLFPAMALSRWMHKNQKGENNHHSGAGREFNMPTWMNALFTNLLKLDIFLIKLGIQLPFGGSLIAVAQKPNKKS